MKSTSPRELHTWRFVTNHAHVLQCLAANPEARLRDVAEVVGITERSAGTIVRDLEEAGYLTKVAVGNRNCYVIHDELPLRHRRHQHHTVGDLLGFLEPPSDA